MGQILVRRIDDDLKARLKSRAAEHGVSMEEEVRIILQNELLRDEPKKPGLGTQIAELFRGIPDNDEPFEWKLDDPVRYERFDK
jgi:plasmid stability protein